MKDNRKAKPEEDEKHSKKKSPASNKSFVEHNKLRYFRLMQRKKADAKSRRKR